MRTRTWAWLRGKPANRALQCVIALRIDAYVGCYLWRNEEKEAQRGDLGQILRQDMAQETNQTQAPLLCSTGCGFYGNPRNNGMCSVCYRDFLQRQNSNSCVSPSGSSSSGSNVGDAELTQLSNSATVTSPAATSPTHKESTHCSGPATASATSAEDNTSGAKSSLTPDCIQSSCVSGRAAAEGSEQADQSSAGSSGTNSSTQGTGRKCSHKRKKRRQENPDENRDVKRASGSEELVGSALQSEEKPKAKKNRCFTCNKKLGLTGFDCRCGNVFCSIHRYSDIHNCTFDYRAYAAEKIRKENPVVSGEKIKKI